MKMLESQLKSMGGREVRGAIGGTGKTTRQMVEEAAEGEFIQQLVESEVWRGTSGKTFDRWYSECYPAVRARVMAKLQTLTDAQLRGAPQQDLPHELRALFHAVLREILEWKKAGVGGGGTDDASREVAMSARPRRFGDALGETVLATLFGGRQEVRAAAVGGGVSRGVDVPERIRDWLMDGPLGEYIYAKVNQDEEKADRVREVVTEQLVPMIEAWLAALPHEGPPTEAEDEALIGLIRGDVLERGKQLVDLAAAVARGVVGQGDPVADAEWKRLMGQSISETVESWARRCAEAVTEKFGGKAYNALQIGVKWAMDEWNRLCAWGNEMAVKEGLPLPGFGFFYQDFGTGMGDALNSFLDSLTEADVVKPAMTRGGSVTPSAI
jgi:hypothetical protein